MVKATPQNRWQYNRILQPYANKLRKRMTRAEACLWKYALRARKMKGYQFRRQRPVLNYIADFMCKELLLVIEVDGYTHLLEEVQRKDKIRQSKLENIGFKVIRFTDDEVVKDMQNVIREIENQIELREVEMGVNSGQFKRGDSSI